MEIVFDQASYETNTPNPDCYIPEDQQNLYFPGRCRPWYTGSLMQQDQVIINDPYLGGVNNDNIYITISAGLQSLETGEFFGVTGADLRTDVILSAV